MSKSPIALRAGTDRPCPVCGSASKGCSITQDGLHLCRGEPQPGWRAVSKAPDAAGFRHYRREEDPRARVSRTSKSLAESPGWPSLTQQFAAQMTNAAREQLAHALKLPIEALDALPVGYQPEENGGPCWTLPEYDAAGRVVGINRRFADGAKKMMQGGNRGLTLPAGWRDRTGPVYLVEGASDTLSLTFCGLSVVGRPSNTGGVEKLIELLADWPSDREIIVVGENDRKADGSWPGRDGAEKTAGALAEKLNRKIGVAYPPAEYKDARAWVVDAAAGSAESCDWPAIGEQFCTALVMAEASEPPAVVSDGRKPRRDWSKSFFTSKQLAERDTRPAWLVKRVLVWHQPAVIAGPQKVLKTSFLVDLAASLASGTPFLGQFETTGHTTVAMLSGESGDDTLKETAKRVCRAKGTSLGELEDRVIWSFDLPALTDPDDLGGLIDYLSGRGARVAVVDPLYLSLLAAGSDGPDARSLYEMGATFRTVALMFKEAGITPILAHHANRQIPAGQAMELHHLAYAGIAEFARQWLLLSRKETYKGDGQHRLWVNIGGSAGQSGQWVVAVNEGVIGDDFEGRTWEVTMQTSCDLHANREAKKRDEARAKMREEETRFLNAVDSETESGQPAATPNSIRKHYSAFSGWKVKDIAERLIDEGLIEEIEFAKPGGKGSAQTVSGYRRPIGRNGGNPPDIFHTIGERVDRVDSSPL